MKKLIFTILLITTSLLLGNQQYIRLKTGIHFDSNVSGGRYSLEELSYIIGKSDLDVAIITDHDNMEVSLGSQFFKNAFQYKIKRNSVAKYGVKNYFNKINELNSFYTNVEIIPGIEAVPYYSWEGTVLDKNLSLNNWHRHLLVFGMENIEDYKNLPSIKTGYSTLTKGDNTLQYFKNHFYYYIFILMNFLFLILLIATSFKRRRHKRKRLPLFRILCFSISLFFCIIEFPYLRSTVSQYHSESNQEAFQELIDYVNNKNGLVFWAHPEAEYNENLNLNIPYLQPEIKIATQKYSHLVYAVKNSTGFAGFWEGMKVLGKPSGLWDLALSEYCDGIRKKPMYVIGELDFEETNNFKLINETNTFIFAKNRTKQAIFDALKNGRMYTTRNFLGDKLVIDDFRVYNLQDESSAFMGETLKINNTPVAINLKISLLENIKPQSFTLYRNTIPIKEFIVDSNIDEWYVDKNIPESGIFYYKLYSSGKWITLVTNPIFVNNN